MRIVVCIKQVPDPEGSAASFQVDAGNKWVTTTGLPPVISPFDENALEAALRIKEATGATITLLGVCPSHSRPVLLKALAVGADDAVLVEGAGLESRNLDSFATAAILAAAISTLDGFDLIMTGRQASDTNAGAVGLGIAELLGIPAVSIAGKIEVDGRVLCVDRILPDGHEVVTTHLPALVTVSHEAGQLRYPAIAAIKAAKQLPLRVMSFQDLEESTPVPAYAHVISVSAPERERRCVMIKEEDPFDTGKRLAERLRADSVI
ncbi:MAG: electron transfer flavoprotein subunit beta/FixA family protein [Candidatus Geothermincolia bacterium]